MIYNKFIVPVTRILSSREGYMYTLKRFDILSQKNLCCKKGKAKKVQITEWHKVWYQFEAKKKSYTS